MVEASSNSGIAEARAVELEARPAAVEVGSVDADFDSVSWVWMFLLGVVFPVVLILGGWFFGRSP